MAAEGEGRSGRCRVEEVDAAVAARAGDLPGVGGEGRRGDAKGNVMVTGAGLPSAAFHRRISPRAVPSDPCRRK